MPDVPNDPTKMTDEQLRLAGLSDADLTAEQIAARIEWLKTLSLDELMNVPIEPPEVVPVGPGNGAPPPSDGGGSVSPGDTDPYSNPEDGEDDGEEGASGVGGN